MTLFTRLILVLALAVLPTLLVVGMHEVRRHDDRVDVQRAARAAAQQLAAELRMTAEGAQQLLLGLAEIQAVAELRPEECDRIVARMHRQFPIYGRIVATDESGVVQCGPGHGRDLSERPHVAQARAARSFTVGELTTSAISGKPILPLAFPMIDEDGRIRGVLVAALQIDELNQRLVQFPLPQRATALVADRTGAIVARFPDAVEAPGVQPARMPDLLAATSAAGMMVTRENGERRLVGFEPPASDPWHGFYVAVSLPYAPVLESVLTNTHGELAAFLAALAFSVVSITLVWRRTVGKPVGKLLSTIERLRKDETARVRLRGASELAQLGSAFDDLLDRLHMRTRALAESEARTGAMLERMRTAARAVHASASSIVIIDARRNDLPIVDVNPAFERVTGFSRDEAIGQDYLALIGLEGSPALDELRRALRDRRECVVQFVGARRCGAPFHCELRIAPVFDEAWRVSHYVAVQNDITEHVESERRLAAAKEEAEASNRAKSQFLANMSHELRTPLNAIIGFSEILQNELFGPMPTRYRAYCIDINDAGRHLLALLNDLLDLARIEGGKMGLELQPVHLEALAEGCLDLVRPEAERRGVVLQSALEPGLEAICDPTRLRQMLLNLLTNAIKFTPRDGNVTVHAQREPRGGLVLQVSDTGIGMTPGEIRIALEPFGQVENALSRKHDGVGLGLPIAKRLAELHGGSLSVASSSSSGTSVTISLPNA
jgi:PAS domain S-box-containing protein